MRVLYWSAHRQFRTEANFSLQYTGMSVLQYPVGFSELDLTKIRHLTFFIPLGAVMEMVGGPSGLPNTASTDDIMIGYKRHERHAISGRILRARLDLTNIRHLTFFIPLGAVMEMVSTSCGRLNADDIMSYKRLADTRWACTSVCSEPHQHSLKVILTTRQGPSYGLGMLIANMGYADRDRDWQGGVSWSLLG
ncbi:hypothetical protein LTR17_002955 [Elasticomyces elasticus]|nr:hypothetical protein LTR17_002955 [Elasticomyces elasticus]